jgi:aarF domain-containing kinase
MPWVRKLVVLCDGAPETPYKMVQKVIEQEFGKPMDSIFERFDCKPLGSASVAQVGHCVADAVKESWFEHIIIYWE